MSACRSRAIFDGIAFPPRPLASTRNGRRSPERCRGAGRGARCRRRWPESRRANMPAMAPAVIASSPRPGYFLLVASRMPWSTNFPYPSGSRRRGTTSCLLSRLGPLCLHSVARGGVPRRASVFWTSPLAPGSRRKRPWRWSGPQGFVVAADLSSEIPEEARQAPGKRIKTLLWRSRTVGPLFPGCKLRCHHV